VRQVWDDVIRSLLLIRLGQELGTNSQLAQMIASFVDVFINQIIKVI